MNSPTTNKYAKMRRRITTMSTHIRANEMINALNTYIIITKIVKK